MDKVKEAVQAHFDKDMEMVEEMTAEGGYVTLLYII